MKTLPLGALAAGLCLSFTSPIAHAGTLTVEKKGLMPALVWIDGTSKGKVKKKRPIVEEVNDGPHEVWVAVEQGGTVTRCHGMVDVRGSTTVEVSDMGGCTNLRQGVGPQGATAFRGSTVDFSITGVDAWVQVDGGQPLALPALPFVLNLTPGTHTIVLWTDNFQTAVYDQGTVTLGPGQRLPVTCTPGGCIGFDAPPQIIQWYPMPTVVVQTPPAPPAPGVGVQVNLPGVNIGVGVSGDGTTVGGSVQVGAVEGAAVVMPGMTAVAGPQGAAVSMPGMTAVAGPGGAVVGGNGTMVSPGPMASGEATCCINGAFYECPDADAVYQCSGAFMACMSACDFTDPSCADRCLRSHPFDPSRCQRTPSRDATCR
jgi:sulfur relay (sulfurtransferase) complex TusBCD TusD component (DsrE family)